MSLMFTGLAVCSAAGVLKGKAFWMLLTIVFGVMAVLFEMKENQGSNQGQGRIRREV